MKLAIPIVFSRSALSSSALILGLCVLMASRSHASTDPRSFRHIFQQALLQGTAQGGIAYLDAASRTAVATNNPPGGDLHHLRDFVAEFPGAYQVPESTLMKMGESVDRFLDAYVKCPEGHEKLGWRELTVLARTHDTPERLMEALSRFGPEFRLLLRISFGGGYGGGTNEWIPDSSGSVILKALKGQGAPEPTLLAAALALSSMHVVHEAGDSGGYGSRGHPAATHDAIDGRSLDELLTHLPEGLRAPFIEATTKAFHMCRFGPHQYRHLARTQYPGASVTYDEIDMLLRRTHELFKQVPEDRAIALSLKLFSGVSGRLPCWILEDLLDTVPTEAYSRVAADRLKHVSGCSDENKVDLLRRYRARNPSPQALERLAKALRDYR